MRRTTTIRAQALHFKYEIPQFHAALRILEAESIVDTIRLCPDNKGIWISRPHEYMTGVDEQSEPTLLALIHVTGAYGCLEDDL